MAIEFDASIESLASGMADGDTLALHQTLRGDVTRLAVSTPSPGAATAQRGIDVPRLGSLPRLALDGSEPTPDLPVPMLDLELLEALGEGGMGVVRRARQRSLRRDVAVKTLHPEAQADTRHALLREGVLAGRLEHPNIVPIHMLGRDVDDAPVVVMKRIEGVSWRALIHDVDHPAWGSDAGRPADQLERHLEIFVDVCRAIEFAHSHDIVHRDIKPDNVMIGAFGEVYVLDWGVAAHVSEIDSTAGGLVGTPVYLAPEMIALDEDRATVGPWTDVYLLGGTLFELLGRRAPHDGHPGLMATLQAAASAGPLVVDGVRPELAELVHRATQREPAARFASVAALREAVTDVVRHRGSIELTERALAAMRALDGLLDAAGTDEDEADQPGSEIARHFTTAQVALRGALDVWPDNQRASEALDELLGRMLEHAIARRNLGFAEQLLAQLEAPSEAQTAAVARLRADEAARARADDELRALRRDHDLGQGQRTRNVALLLVTLVGVAVSIYIVSTPSTATELTIPELIAFDGFLMGVFVVTTVVARKRLLANLINRRITASLGLVFCGLLFNRLAALASGTTVAEALRGDLLVETATLAMLSLFVTPRLWGATVVALVGMMVCGVAPHLAVASFAVTNLFVPIGAIAAMTRRATDD